MRFIVEVEVKGYLTSKPKILIYFSLLVLRYGDFSSFLFFSSLPIPGRPAHFFIIFMEEVIVPTLRPLRKSPCKSMCKQRYIHCTGHLGWVLDGCQGLWLFWVSKRIEKQFNQLFEQRKPKRIPPLPLRGYPYNRCIVLHSSGWCCSISTWSFDTAPPISCCIDLAVNGLTKIF